MEKHVIDNFSVEIFKNSLSFIVNRQISQVKSMMILSKLKIIKSLKLYAFVPGNQFQLVELLIRMLRNGVLFPIILTIYSSLITILRNIGGWSLGSNFYLRVRFRKV